MTKKNNSFPSEIRYDIISQDWVIIAKGRGKRPVSKNKDNQLFVSSKDCPFCQIETQLPPLLVMVDGKKIEQNTYPLPKNWSLVVIPNKFPALLPGEKMFREREGRYYIKISGIGYCELVVPRDHRKHFPHFSTREIKEIFDAYQERYLSLMKKKFVNHISIFHNHGPKAGATQPHCHSQIITTFLIDNDLSKTLLRAKKFYKKQKKCIYCELQKWEQRQKTRVVFENKHFLAICPFASKTAFEVIISPKRHLSYFERISEEEKESLSQIFKVIFVALEKVLGNDFNYNFYLHTAPCDGKDYRFYHWHWTILPRTSVLAGFELGTRMEVCTIEPEVAAFQLKEAIKSITI